MAFDWLVVVSAFFLGAGMYDHYRSSKNEPVDFTASVLVGLLAVAIAVLADIGRILHASPTYAQSLFESLEFVLLFGVVGAGAYAAYCDSEEKAVRALPLAGAFFGGYLVLAALFGALLG